MQNFLVVRVLSRDALHVRRPDGNSESPSVRVYPLTAAASAMNPVDMSRDAQRQDKPMLLFNLREGWSDGLLPTWHTYYQITCVAEHSLTHR
jgi:hypothetical protein